MDKKRITKFDNRQTFLKSFLGALGVVKIKWIEITPKYVKGTAIYNFGNMDERQDFIWKISEYDSPNKNTRILMDYIKREKLLDIDKLTKSINEINIPNLNDKDVKEAFEFLFDISVTMIDEGKETDIYFIHP